MHAPAEPSPSVCAVKNRRNSLGERATEVGVTFMHFTHRDRSIAISRIDNCYETKSRYRTFHNAASADVHFTRWIHLPDEKTQRVMASKALDQGVDSATHNTPASWEMSGVRPRCRFMGTFKGFRPNGQPATDGASDLTVVSVRMRTKLRERLQGALNRG